jgi:hypothetical protein
MTIICLGNHLLFVFFKCLFSPQLKQRCLLSYLTIANEMVPLFKPSTFRLNGLNHDDVGGNRPPTYPTLVVARKAFQ